jgi:hypothetical protein
MPDLPLAQQIFLGGVVAAFTIFILAVGWAHVYVNLKPAPAKRDQTRR